MNSFTVIFEWPFTVNSKSTYIMNIFLRLSKNIAACLSLPSFLVLVMYVSMVHAAEFAAAFYGD